MPPKSYATPFSITPDIINAVVAISEAIGRIAAFNTQASSLKLRRANHIRTIHRSWAIEGNTLSEAQITTILDGKQRSYRPATGAVVSHGAGQGHGCG